MTKLCNHLATLCGDFLIYKIPSFEIHSVLCKRSTHTTSKRVVWLDNDTRRVLSDTSFLN